MTEQIRDVCCRLISNSENALQFLKFSNDVETKLKELTKDLYNLLKKEEHELGLSHNKKSLKSLYIDGLEAEQVWQQLELRNASLLDCDSSLIKDDNLCYLVAKLSSSITDEYDDEEVENADGDGGSEGEDASVEVEDASEEDENANAEDEGENETDVEKDKIEEAEVDSEGEEIDFDADTYGDLAQEGEDTDDEDSNHASNVNSEDNSEMSESSEQKKEKLPYPSNKVVQKFKSSIIDSQCLNLRESEWIADNDIIGRSLNEDNDEDIDLMADLESDSSDHDIKYEQFFDPPPESEEIETTPEEEEEINLNTEAEEPSENQDTEKVDETVHTEPLANAKLDGRKSKFDIELEKEESLKEKLIHENYILEKPWFLKGEATKEQRPENSTLEELLEYNYALNEKPVLTEDITQQIEKLILSRLRNNTWDDVERKQRPKTDPFKYKERLILNQEKSQKDLAKIYEEEYMNQQQKTETETESLESHLAGRKEVEGTEPEVNKEIRTGLRELFANLDALSNYHFTPKHRNAELKIVTNLSSIALEEAIPDSTSSATLLAPREIVAPLKGELKGERERSSTDRKRQRRAKKLHQKKKEKLQEEKLKALMKRSKDGLLQKEASIQLVQKAIKKGQIKLLKPDENSQKPSSSFLSLLQNDKNLKRKPQEEMQGKKRKKLKNISSVAKVRL